VNSPDFVAPVTLSTPAFLDPLDYIEIRLSQALTGISSVSGREVGRIVYRELECILNASLLNFAAFAQKSSHGVAQ
jgi:hypothetical protein